MARRGRDLLSRAADTASAARRRAQRAPDERRPTSPGFTLLELVAVVTILALLSAIVIPRIGVFRGRAIRAQGTQLAADLELARTRAQILGIPHRVLLDLDRRSWRMDWLVTEAEALGEAAPATALASSGDERLSLAPPRGDAPEFRPVPISFGHTTLLSEEITSARVETSAGPLTHGAVSIVFERDGSAEPLLVVLADDGGRGVELVIEPLEEEVQVRDHGE